MVTQTDSELPIPAQSVASMVATYHDAQARIRAACLEIDRQHARIAAAFGEQSHITLETRNLRFSDPSDEIKKMDRWAWRAIVNVSGMRRMLSVKAAKELDEQLERGELPKITEESVNGFIGATKDQAVDRLAEAVKEVHNFLRPERSRYKTNTEFDIGKRVILTYWVTRGYGRPYMAHYHRHSEYRALDNVFAILDGKTTIATHNGPLADAIAASTDGTGETEYFRFRACANQNLHLEFKRMDLVAKLNAVAGGNALYAGKAGGR